MEKMKKLVVVFFCAFMLTGCYKVDLNINVDKDLKTSAVMEILMKKDLASEDDLNSAKDNPMKGFKVVDKNVKKTIDGDEYVGIKLESKDTSDTLKVKVSEKDGEVRFEMDMSSSDSELAMDQLGGEGADMSSLKAMDVEFNVTIKMPGKIKKAEGGKISGSSVTYDLLDYKGEEIIVTSEKGANSLMFVIFGGVIVAIGAVAFAVWKMRKSKNAVDASSSEDVQEDTSEELIVNEPPVTSEETKEEKNTKHNTKHNRIKRRLK